MRILSLVLAAALFLLGPSMAGSPEGSLPTIGTFSYNGSPVMADATQLTVVAIR